MTAPVDEPYDGSGGIPRSGGTIVRVTCADGHGGRQRFTRAFIRDNNGAWVGLHADDAQERADVLVDRPKVYGGVVRFAGGWAVTCTRCGRSARVRDEVLRKALDAVVSFGGKEIQLDTLARLVGQ